MPDAQSAVIRGVDLGLSRCRENLRFFAPPPALKFEIQSLAHDAIARAGLGNRNTRGLEIVAELITLAVVTRRQYDEPALLPEQLALFAWNLTTFLNSWFHE